jgi:1,4-dihydroxy-2-naphthoate octaprenyltransferase
MGTEESDQPPVAEDPPQILISDSSTHEEVVAVSWRPLRPSPRALAPSPLWLALTAALVGSSLSWAQGTIRMVPTLLLFSALTLLAGGANLLAAGYTLMHAPRSSWTVSPRSRRLSWLHIYLPVHSPAARASFAGYICLVLALILGLILALESSALILLPGILGLVAAVTYRLPHYAWADQPWAEIMALLLLGPATVLAADLAQTGVIHGLALSLSMPVGFLAAATLLSDHFRYFDSELSTRPRALPTYLGLARSQLLLALLVALAYLWVTVLGSRQGFYGLLLAWFSLPTALVALTSALVAAAPRARHLIVHHVAQLHRSFTLWLALGTLLNGLMPWLIVHWPHP